MRRSKRSCFVYIYQLNAHQFSFKHFYIPNSFSFYAFNTSPLRPHAKLRNKYTARPLTSFQVPTLLSLYYLMGYLLIYYYFFKEYCHNALHRQNRDPMEWAFKFLSFIFTKFSLIIFFFFLKKIMHCVYERREVNSNTIGRLQWMGTR